MIGHFGPLERHLVLNPRLLGLSAIAIELFHLGFLQQLFPVLKLLLDLVMELLLSVHQLGLNLLLVLEVFMQFAEH